MAVAIDQLMKLCKEVLAPLLRADGGKLYVVALEPNHLALHLAGKFGGCPGTPLVVKQVIEPAVRAVAPQIELQVTCGMRIPDGASLLQP
jgi:Fe-S cluster biogenesis protein NfuA